MTNYGEYRYRFFIGLFIFIGSIFIIRLFYLQVIETTYKVSARQNAIRKVYEIPSRGLIYDRNGVLLVQNSATYDLMVIPRQIEKFDTLKLCKILKIDLAEYVRLLNKVKKYSNFLPSVLIPSLTEEQYSQFKEFAYEFPGHFIQLRSVRNYPKPIAAHTLGFIGEATQDIIDSDPYYNLGDYMGVSGIEKSYENVLRGVKGWRMVLVDVHNREMGKFENGKYDKMPVSGTNIYLGLDARLQELGEELMQNKRGGIVAIEPATGEILACVSSPAYDPNILVGANRKTGFKLLFSDKENNPLFNRALMTRYPPGSTFKIVSGLAAYEEGIIDENTVIGCGGGYRIGNHVVRCHPHPGPLNLIGAIANSCNPYFCEVFRRFIDNKKFSSSQEAYEKWREYVNSMGFGVLLHTDYPHELAGFIPTAEFYNKRLRTKNWRASSIISVAIGQGEVGATPLQLANLACIIANRGWYIVPHFVKAIGDINNPNKNYKKKVQTLLSAKTCEVFADGMRQVVVAGTAKNAEIPGYEVCGKTGTAQAGENKKNHSVFIAFAPKNNPKIAIGVLVEHSGYGATWAAPIASLMIEQYLTGEIKRQDLYERIKQANLLK